MRQKPEIEVGSVEFFTKENGGYGFVRPTNRMLMPATFADTVHLTLNSGHSVAWAPWQFGPHFAQRHGQTYGVNGSRKETIITPPREGDEIRFVRAEPIPGDTGHPYCLKWAHATDWDKAQESINNQPTRLRVVRVARGETVDVLWETHEGSGSAAVLVLSARFPRSSFARDELSRSYARSRGNEIKAGLAIETFNEDTQSWERAGDVRAPTHSVPDALRGRFLAYT